MSFRGLDNAGYYSLDGSRQGYEHHNGVGPDLNTRSAAGQAVIIESLKYWHEVLGVDGFRFDLAPVLGNACEHGCFRYSRDDPGTALNRLTPQLKTAHLIAEPWAIGAGGYQLGNFPKGWSEWNGQYRDTARSVQNLMGVEATPLQALLLRLVGSPDLFQDDGRGPAASVNYVVSHDGFTLRDLYACNAKSNEQQWPYGPSSGGDDHNRSWDQGGDAANQRRAARTGLALLLTSAGTPMFTGGDEQLRSVRCNNNAYNLDSSANWLAFPLQPHELTFRGYVQRLLAFRRAHPALRPERWWRGDDGNGNRLEQVRWFQPSGAVADTAYLANANNHALAWRLDGTELGESGAVFIAYNGWSGAIDFTLPATIDGQSWFLAGDTCNAGEGADQLATPGAERALGGAGTKLGVCARGVALVVSR
jgi:glycogen operon protein